MAKIGSGQVNAVALAGWCEQAAEECRVWARDVTGIKDEQRLDDFVAGVKRGWAEARRSLVAHGVITLAEGGKDDR